MHISNSSLEMWVGDCVGTGQSTECGVWQVVEERPFDVKDDGLRTWNVSCSVERRSSCAAMTIRSQPV